MRSSQWALPLRVLIADGSEANNEALSELLAEHDEIEVVGSAQSAIQTLTLIEKLHPDAVLVDSEMLGETLGFVLKLIKKDSGCPAIILVIPYASTALRERALDAGADYVLAKTSDPECIINVLQKLIQARQLTGQCNCAK
jgi:two-component system, LytTR family, response regulator AlgR